MQTSTLEAVQTKKKKQIFINITNETLKTTIICTTN